MQEELSVNGGPLGSEGYTTPQSQVHKHKGTKTKNGRPMYDRKDSRGTQPHSPEFVSTKGLRQRMIVL